MEPADARRSASTMMSSSITLSFTGEHVGWTTYVSTPRTFSWITQNVSPSEKRETRDLPSGNSRQLQISCVRAGFAFPEKMATLLNTDGAPPSPGNCGERAHVPGAKLPVKREGTLS